MTRSHLLSAAILSACTIVPHIVPAQPAPPQKLVAFDVATIRPIAPDGRPSQGWMGMEARADGVDFDFRAASAASVRGGYG